MDIEYTLIPTSTDAWLDVDRVDVRRDSTTGLMAHIAWIRNDGIDPVTFSLRARPWSDGVQPAGLKRQLRTAIVIEKDHGPRK